MLRAIYVVLCAGAMAIMEVRAEMSIFCVDPIHGKDTNIGSVAQPYNSIARARDAVRDVNAAMTDDIHVLLRGGWYFQAEPLTFDARDSGTKGHRVIYRAHPGEYPAISGGRLITGWTLFDRQLNIWHAPAPGLHTRQLYVNCRRAQRAHNGVGFRGLCKLTDTGYTLSPEDSAMGTWRNPGDIELVWNGGQGTLPGWMERRCPIRSINGNAIAMQDPGWMHCIRDGASWGGAVRGGPTDIENAFELLDTPGEWYLDRTEGTVYYIPRAEENLAAATVVAPVLESLVVGSGSPERPISNITFTGITFAHATWLLPGSEVGWPEGQANYMYYTKRRPLGNVTFTGTRALRMERCTFTHLGGAGLDIYGGSKDNVIVGCVFTDISGNCLQLGSITDPMRADVTLRDDGNQVINCYLHDSPVEYRGGCAIMAAYVSDTLIAHNDISNTPYTGISLGWGWDWELSYANSNRVNCNRIYDVLQSLADGGCIYTLGAQADSEWGYNFVSDWMNVQSGLYPDNGTSYFDIHHNVALAPAQPAGTFSVWYYLNGKKGRYGSHDNHIRNNFTDLPLEQNVTLDGRNTIRDNMRISDTEFPAEARDIMMNAGIEPAYGDIRTMPCACAIMNPGQDSNLPDAARVGALIPRPRGWNDVPVSTTLCVGEEFACVGGQGSGTIRVSIENCSPDELAEGQIRLDSFPKAQCTFRNGNTVEYSLNPGERLVKDIPLIVCFGTSYVVTRTSSAGVMRSRVKIQTEGELTRIPGASLGELREKMAALPAMAVRDFGCAITAGSLRLALVGDSLALCAEVIDGRGAGDAASWPGSGVELYFAAGQGGEIRQFALTPPQDGQLPRAIVYEGGEGVPVPDVQVAVQPAREGYHVQALIPLGLLRLPADSSKFLFEALISANVTGNDRVYNVTLCHSLNAFMNTSRYGIFRMPSSSARPAAP